MSTPGPLKYLFVAEYNDGTTFTQRKDDKSRGPIKGSAFTDIDQDKLIAFSLVGDGRTIKVDLIDGHFEVNGVPIWVADQLFIKVNPYRLVYFLETRVEQTVQATVEKDMSITRKVESERHYHNRYFIGWQTTDRFKKNIQHTIAIN